MSVLVSVIVSVARATNTNTPTPTTYLLIALAALISVCRCMRAGVCMVVVCLLIGRWLVILVRGGRLLVSVGQVSARATPTLTTYTYLN